MQACTLYRSVLWSCILCSILVIGRQIRANQRPDNLKTIVQVHLQNSRKPLALIETSEPQQVVRMTQPKKCSRFELAKASRAWRQGVPTALIMDQDLHMLQDADVVQAELDENLEFWATSPDIPPTNPLTEKAGDFRAALAPFLANKTAAPASYKWILYGDDDTFWFIDNALVYLSQLDPDMPYLLSDNIWLKERNSDMAIHPNPKAPRCLPCNLPDELVGQVPPGSFDAPVGCPCTSDALCQSDVNSVMYNRSDCQAQWPFISHVPSPGYWYFIHGGAGAIMSRGLMDLTSYERCHEFITGPMPRMSGDAMFTLTVWHMMGTPPTDPGYGFYRPHVQMMDPGWLADRTQRGPEDQGTRDGGNDPVGVVKRFQQALHGTVNEQTRDQLDHVLTVHFRGRYAAADVTSLSPEHEDKPIGTNNFKATVHLHHHMAYLYEQYLDAC